MRRIFRRQAGGIRRQSGLRRGTRSQRTPRHARCEGPALTMFQLRLHIEHAGAVTTLLFPRLPVRIGRDPEADCCLAFPFVSRKHARLDFEGGRVVLRDEGSRRGTWVVGASRRLGPGEQVDLQTVGSEFFIGTELRIRVELQPATEDGVPTTSEPAASSGIVSTSYYADADIDPRALDAEAIERSLLDALEKHHGATKELSDVLLQAAACAPAHVERFAELLVKADPEWDGHASIRQFVTGSGIVPEPSRVDATALRALQELAASHVPYGPPLNGVEAVVGFVTRLDAVLTLLLEGVAAMRYAAERETGRQVPRPPSRTELAAALLDWTNDGELVERLREELAFMLGHHRRLVDEVTTRLAGILEHLSPAAIEDHCATARWPGRRKALWREFERRHATLVRLRERALGPVFGAVARALNLSARGRVEARPDEPLPCGAELLPA